MTIRVAVVARSVFPLHGHGGLERHVYDLVRHLADAGVVVTLVTRPTTSGASARSLHEAVRIETVPYRTFPFAGRRGTTVLDRSTAYPLFGERAGRRAFELARSGRADIVHGLGASVLGYARRRSQSSAPLVLNPQGLEEFGATSPERARLKRLAYYPLRRAVLACARAADRVIATDAVLEPVVRRHLGVAAERIVTIPNALDLPALDALAPRDGGARLRAAAGMGPHEPLVLSVGRLEENKGFHLLAEALARLQSQAWRWVVIGEGPYRTRLEAAIGAAGIAARVTLSGQVGESELHGWYETATVFAHPTLYEGSSLVTLEAMAHRRACVVTTAGGLPDKVREGVNGWLVAPGDPDALSAAVAAALAVPPEVRARFGAASRRIVESEFSWTAAGAATIRVYRELLEPR